MYFIDSNIFMYAIGSEHPHKKPCLDLVEKINNQEIKACINTEILQEVLYRYDAIGKSKIGFKLFDKLLQTFDTIWEVNKQDLIKARALQEKSNLKTRDAIHAACMINRSVKSIYSYDRDFDKIKNIQRMIP
jgi:predicted nucleic acid-binding protein